MNDFRQREVRYQDYTRTLAAGVPQTLDVSGDYWQLIKTPGGEVLMELDDTVRLVRFAPSGGPGNFRRVTVTSATDQTIVIALGFTNGLVPYDNRTVINGSLTVSEQVAAAVDGLADLTINAAATGTFAANLLRETIVISLDDGAPNYVRVASPAAASGVRLYPGGSISMRTTSAIQVRNPNAVPVTVSATETTNP